MAETVPQSPRERYRTQVRAEVKEHAWEQIASAGASALSLNAIAKRMGMSGPALYRYYASRDELVTELITDAYRSLADALRAAGPGAELARLAHTVRDWALADPHRYFLVFGTPVPGYHAPDDVTAIASEIMATLLDASAALAEGAEDSRDAKGSKGTKATKATKATKGHPATPFDVHLDDHRDWADGHPAPSPVLHRALSFWTRVHGVLSLELAGHFGAMGFDPALFFAAEVDDLLAR